MKNIFVIALLAIILASCNSTKDVVKVVESEATKIEKAAVQKAIMTMFDGMRAGDSSMVSSVFLKEVDMISSFNNKAGKPIIHRGSIEGFLKAVGTPHKEVWNEVIHSYDIRIDDNLAQVWTPYSFFLDDKLQHCGVNAFQLTKTNDGWKIFQLADTRRRKGCKENEK